MRNFTSGALAVLLATAAGGSILVEQAQHAGQRAHGLAALSVALPASADDNEGNGNRAGDSEDKHDNGKHKGWYKKDKDNENGNGKHGARGTTVTGFVNSINGSLVGVRLLDNRTITVNDQTLVNRGVLPVLTIGQEIRLRGNYGSDGVFYANSIADATNQYGATTACGQPVTGATTLSGYATRRLGNGDFVLSVPAVADVPVPYGATSYTIHVDNRTCINGTSLSSLPYGWSTRVRVVGQPIGDGRSLVALQVYD